MIEKCFHENLENTKGLLKTFVQIQYNTYCKSQNLPQHDIYIDLGNDTINPGSKEYCEHIRLLMYIDKSFSKSIDRKVFDLYITDKPVYSVGDYISYIAYYIEKYGKTDKLNKICDNLLQDRIYNLTTYQKLYIKNELITLKNHGVCLRLVDRILAQIQGYPEPAIIYKEIDGKLGEFIRAIDGKLNYKYYPF
jgi:hypothetical protein